VGEEVFVMIVTCERSQLAAPVPGAPPSDSWNTDQSESGTGSESLHRTVIGWSPSQSMNSTGPQYTNGAPFPATFDCLRTKR
jgi:hypothetical protein